MESLSSLLRGALSAALLLLLWLAGPAARAQAPAWQMAVVAGGTGSFVQAMATDAAGNVYLTGSLFGTVNFGNTTLTSAGNADVFVAKWSTQTAGFVWAQRAGGSGEDRATAVAISGTSVYVAGLFASSTAGFGSIALTRSGPAIANGFVTKLTDAGSTGSFVWAQRADNAIAGVAATGAAVYLAGTLTQATVTFGGTMLFNSGGYDAFVVKLTDAGSTSSFTWAQRVGGAGYDYASAIAVSGTSIYLTGDFEDTANFGNATLTSAGNSDIYVTKLTDAGSTGSIIWAQRAGSTSKEKAVSIVSSGLSAYVTGNFGNASASFGNTVLSNAGDTDVFVAKLIDAGATGSFAWAQSAGGPNAEWAGAVAVSGTGVYITGTFFSPRPVFGSTTLSNVSYAGDSDTFVAKLIDAGNNAAFAWAQQAGGDFFEQGWGIGIVGSTVYVGGDFSSPASFGPYTLNGTDPSLLTGFLAALTDPTLTATVAAQSTLSFTLAPNPARATTTVQLPGQPGTATVTLLDALGRIIRTRTVALPSAGLRHELDLSGLPAGLYAVQVRAGAATATRRLVVE